MMNQEAVTDMVLQEEMVETSAQEKADMGSSEELAETGDIQILSLIHIYVSGCVSLLS